jgi:hypothetical protein
VNFRDVAFTAAIASDGSSALLGFAMAVRGSVPTSKDACKARKINAPVGAFKI